MPYNVSSYNSALLFAPPTYNTILQFPYVMLPYNVRPYVTGLQCSPPSYNAALHCVSL